MPLAALRALPGYGIERPVDSSLLVGSLQADSHNFSTGRTNTQTGGSRKAPIQTADKRIQPERFAIVSSPHPLKLSQASDKVVILLNLVFIQEMTVGT